MKPSNELDLKKGKASQTNPAGFRTSQDRIRQKTRRSVEHLRSTTVDRAAINLFLLPFIDCWNSESKEPAGTPSKLVFYSAGWDEEHFMTLCLITTAVEQQEVTFKRLGHERK